MTGRDRAMTFGDAMGVLNDVAADVSLPEDVCKDAMRLMKILSVIRKSAYSLEEAGGAVGQQLVPETMRQVKAVVEGVF